MLQQILDNLNLDPAIMLLNGVLFLVLLGILNAIFWKPMMAHLDARKSEISGAYKAVEDTRREMENLRAEYQGSLAAIEAEARGRIQETVRDAQNQREAMIAEARTRAEAIIKEGAESIEEERHRTLAGMRETLDDVTVHALTKALHATPDPLQRQQVDAYIAEHVLTSQASRYSS